MYRRKTFAKAGFPLVAAVCLMFGLFMLASCEGEDGGEETALSSESCASESEETLNFYPYLWEPSEEGSEEPVPVSETSSGTVCAVGEFFVELPCGYVYRPVRNFDFCARNDRNCLVVLTVDSMNDLYERGFGADLTAEKYAEKVIIKGNIDACPHGGESRAYFEYRRNMKGGPHCYFAYVYKGTTAFYLLQFCCSEDDVETFRAQFSGIADDVVINPLMQD